MINGIINAAGMAHTIARNKLQARWKNYTPPTQARKINTQEWRISYGKLVVKWHGKITHKIHTLKIDWIYHAQDGNCVEYMDGKIILDIRENIEYISPSE